MAWALTMFVFYLLGSDAYHQSKQIVTFGALQCGNQLKHASQMTIQTCITNENPNMHFTNYTSMLEIN